MPPPVVILAAPAHSSEDSGVGCATTRHLPHRVVVLAADDHIRTTWRRELEPVRTVHLLGDTAAVNEAIQLIRTHRPSIIVLDPSIPGWHPATVIRAIRQWAPVGAAILAVRPTHSSVQHSVSSDELRQAGATLCSSTQDRLSSLLSSLPARSA
ncbi:MAG: hypothetical protein U0172_08775 [Nitrospiraceae bacterium]